MKFYKAKMTNHLQPVLFFGRSFTETSSSSLRCLKQTNRQTNGSLILIFFEIPQFDGSLLLKIKRKWNPWLLTESNIHPTMHKTHPEKKRKPKKILLGSFSVWEDIRCMATKAKFNVTHRKNFFWEIQCQTGQISRIFLFIFKI